MRITGLRSVLFLVGLLFCVACNSSDPVSFQDPSVLGAWGLNSIDDESGIRVYAKLESLGGDQDGYMFEPDGFLLVRNAGWCGTPPLSYANFEGSWTEEQDGHLILTYSNWEAMQDYRLEILDLRENELRCRLTVVE